MFSTHRNYEKNIQPLILQQFGSFDNYYEFLQHKQTFRKYWRPQIREIKRKTMQIAMNNTNDYLKERRFDVSLANNHSFNQWEILRKAVTLNTVEETNEPSTRTPRRTRTVFAYGVIVT